MLPLTAAINRDLIADVTTITLNGELNLDTVSNVRASLLKCQAECPAAIVVDLRQVQVSQPVALTVFPTAAKRQDFGPECPILLCLGPILNIELVRASVRPLALYDTPETARLAAETARAMILQVAVTIPYSVNAPRAARREVTKACGEWGLEHIGGAAELIASELVTNVVRHAGTDTRLELSFRGDFLHIRVHDYSTVQPTMPTAESSHYAVHGRGLYLVDLYSTGWGYVVNGSGKVVWATLRARPISARTQADSST
jgi:anti-sigma regulatory factor (Ser/Thr protein kinase)